MNSWGYLSAVRGPRTSRQREALQERPADVGVSGRVPRAHGAEPDLHAAAAGRVVLAIVAVGGGWRPGATVELSPLVHRPLGAEERDRHAGHHGGGPTGVGDERV